MRGSALDVLLTGNGEVHRRHLAEQFLEVLTKVLPLGRGEIGDPVPHFLPVHITQLREVEVLLQGRTELKEVGA